MRTVPERLSTAVASCAGAGVEAIAARTVSPAPARISQRGMKVHSDGPMLSSHGGVAEGRWGRALSAHDLRIISYIVVYFVSSASAGHVSLPPDGDKGGGDSGS